MKIIFTEHAKRRIRERALSLRVVKAFIEKPDSVAPSRKDTRRFLIKKIYTHPTFKKIHLLMAICEEDGGTFTVVTIIDTSKIRKYS